MDNVETRADKISQMGGNNSDKEPCCERVRIQPLVALFTEHGALARGSVIADNPGCYHNPGAFSVHWTGHGNLLDGGGVNSQVTLSLTTDLSGMHSCLPIHENPSAWHLGHVMARLIVGMAVTVPLL